MSERSTLEFAIILAAREWFFMHDDAMLDRAIQALIDYDNAQVVAQVVAMGQVAL